MELPGSIRDNVFEAQAAEMMLLITQATGSGQTTAPSSTSVLVARAVAYLQTHYQDPTLTTVQLAQELYASREHLSRAFKECTMESIHNYLTYLRMQHCRKALEEGVSVLNACTESGFPDYSSFLKAFRRLYGITPRRIPRTALDNGALKAAAGEYENFSQKGLTFYPLCGIILEQSARAAEKQKSKYRGVEQSGSSSGS